MLMLRRVRSNRRRTRLRLPSLVSHVGTAAAVAATTLLVAGVLATSGDEHEQRAPVELREWSEQGAELHRVTLPGHGECWAAVAGTMSLMLCPDGHRVASPANP